MSEGVKRHHRFGSVVSNKMQKTVVVAVSRSVIHPVYRKVLKRVTRLKAHDESGQCKVGDRVKIIQTRPLSKDKNWRVVQIMEKGQTEK